jgi:hypothetical protein
VGDLEALMCRECRWKELEYEIDEMLGDDAYEWALDTLGGIQETVIEKEHVTEKQREAIENIRVAVESRR